jgi:hypothetical protein
MCILTELMKMVVGTQDPFFSPFQCNVDEPIRTQTLDFATKMLKHS